MSLRWVRLCVSVAVALGGCHKKPSTAVPLPVNSAKPKAVASAAGSAAVPTPSAVAPERGELALEDQPWEPQEYEPAMTDEAQRLFNRELLVARKAVSEKRYDDALTHYTKALSTGRNDAQCLGERGYVKLLKKQIAAAASDLWLAAGGVGSDRTLSQVWYNIGLARTEQEQPELARAAFARSLAFGPSRQTEAKLGLQSRCQTSVRRAPALGESPAEVVTGWRAVHKFLNSRGEPKTESEARSLACATHSEYEFANVMTVEPNCTSAPPWIMSCCAGFGHFMAMYMMVYPRPNNRFFTINYGMLGGWPGGCQGASEPEAAVYGHHLVLKTVDVGLEPNTDFAASLGEGDPPCRNGPQERVFQVYDLDTAKHMLEISSPTPGAPALTFNDAGTQATLSGAGCDVTLSLP